MVPNRKPALQRDHKSLRRSSQRLGKSTTTPGIQPAPLLYILLQLPPPRRVERRPNAQAPHSLAPPRVGRRNSSQAPKSPPTSRVERRSPTSPPSPRVRRRPSHPAQLSHPPPHVHVECRSEPPSTPRHKPFPQSYPHTLHLPLPWSTPLTQTPRIPAPPIFTANSCPSTPPATTSTFGTKLLRTPPS